MSIFIIEGMDRCGKSTTVANLRSTISNHKLICHHSSKPPKYFVDPIEWSDRHYEDLLQTMSFLSTAGFDIILDRAHLGEFVYGPLYRKRSTNDKEMFRGEKFLDRDDTFLLVMVDSAKNILDRDDGQSLGNTEDQLTYERNRFVSAYLQSDIKHKCLIDWSDEIFDDMEFSMKMSYVMNQLTKFKDKDLYACRP